MGACGYGDQRVRTLLQTPTKLMYVSKQGFNESSGRHTQFFQLADIIPRLREQDATPEMLEKLMLLDQKRRHVFQ